MVNRVSLVCTSLACFVLAAGCRESSPVDPASGTALAPPCAVRAVLEQNCQSCHGNPTRYGAPMPLVTLADFHRPSQSDPSQQVYQRVAARIRDDLRPMPPPPNARLQGTDLDVLRAWLDAGAATSGASCAPPASAPDGSAPQAFCAADRHLEPASLVAVPDEDDSFRCYGVDAPAEAKRHVIGVLPRVDDAAIVHHMILFLTDAPLGKDPVPCDPGGEPGWRMLSVWTPGAQPIELPTSAGFPEDGTTHYAVQIHYQNPHHEKAHHDSSGFDLCTTDKLRPYDADVMVFGTEDFSIPAHGALDLSCDYTIPKEAGGIHLSFVLPHMHTHGKSISAMLRPDAGTVELADRTPFQYGNQYWTRLDSVATPGDVIRTRCAWANPGDSAIGFGESVDAEMCWAFTIYYPKLTTPGFHWDTPALTGACHPSF